MVRHKVIGRIEGSSAPELHEADDSSVRTELQLTDTHSRLRFGLASAIEGAISKGLTPSEDAVDLLLLAALVTAADTRLPRKTYSQDGWTREIALSVPVASVERWSGLQQKVERLLGFLTGDRWSIGFHQREATLSQLCNTARAAPAALHESICLFSGGLDSYVGAIDLLARGELPVFVSHYGDNSTSSQERCMSIIDRAYPGSQERHLRANIRVSTPEFGAHGGTEPTTRGRSFLFFALAALTGSGLSGRSTIYVPENGLISLNVPLDPLRIGAWSTRTTHPFYMARWQEILNDLRIQSRLENPYRFKTKGEMLCESPNQSLLAETLSETISCSSVTKARWRARPPNEQCGYCVPCLIRRAAITRAYGSDPTPYTLAELGGRPLDSQSAEGQHIRSFQLLAQRLRNRPELARILIYKPGPLVDYSPQEIEQYGGVFRRGIAEIEAFVGQVVVRPR